MHEYTETKSKYTGKIGPYKMQEQMYLILWSEKLCWAKRGKKFWDSKNKHTFYINIQPKYFPCVSKFFPVFSLSGKSKNHIPCFPCVMATLTK